MTETVDVAIVGGGAIGACIALELARAGARTVVFEQGPGWGQGCSWGNGGFICPSHAAPYADASDIARSVAWLARPSSPLGIVPSSEMLRFMPRLLGASLSRRGRELAADTLLALARDSLELHQQYADEGIRSGLTRAGLLDVFRTSRGFAKARRGLAGREVLSPSVLSARETQEAEPLLGPRVRGGILYPHEAHCDPALFVQGVGQAAEQAGSSLLVDTEVLQVRPSRDCVEIGTTRGAFKAGTVVLAVGAGRRLLPAVPLTSGAGFSVDLADDPPRPRRPMLVREDRVAITPFADRVRLVGCMVFGSHRPAVDSRRIAGIRASAELAIPSFSGQRSQATWAGARPCTPDGLPLVGPLRGSPNVIAATGHAMLGITLAPVTGVLVRAIISGEPADPRLAALRPERFR